MENHLKKTALPSAILFLLLQGCATFPAAMSGQYDARNGQFLIVDSRGDLYWSPLSKTRDHLMFIGTIDKNVRGEEASYLRASSNSRFFTTTVRYSDDNKRIDIEWSRFSVDSGTVRATEYFRIESTK